MLLAHAATFGRSVLRLVVIYALCWIMGHIIYHGGEIARLKENRGPNAQIPPELVEDLDEIGLTDEQISEFARFLYMQR